MLIPGNIYEDSRDDSRILLFLYESMGTHRELYFYDIKHICLRMMSGTICSSEFTLLPLSYNGTPAPIISLLEKHKSAQEVLENSPFFHKELEIPYKLERI